MHTLDLEKPEPSLVAWSRTARPLRITRRRDVEVGLQSPRRPVTALSAWLDDALFGFSAATFLLLSLLPPLVAWLL